MTAVILGIAVLLIVAFVAFVNKLQRDDDARRLAEEEAARQSHLQNLLEIKRNAANRQYERNLEDVRYRNTTTVYRNNTVSNVYSEPIKGLDDSNVAMFTSIYAGDDVTSTTNTDNTDNSKCVVDTPSSSSAHTSTSTVCEPSYSSHSSHSYSDSSSSYSSSYSDSSSSYSSSDSSSSYSSSDSSSW